jgi:hypothetical protein
MYIGARPTWFILFPHPHGTSRAPHFGDLCPNALYIHMKLVTCRLNIMVEWLEFVLHIQILAWKLTIILRFFVVSLSPLGKWKKCRKINQPTIQANADIVRYLKLGHDRFLPHPFQFIIHLSAFHLTIYSLSY